MAADLEAEGHRPFHLPVGVLLDQDAEGDALPHSPCIRCDRFDGYPCLTNGKSDAQVISIDPTLAAHPNVTLMTHTDAERLLTDPGGGTLTRVRVRGDIVDDDPTTGQPDTLHADVVVVACGALSSALLMLRSKSAAHPDGLGNRSGLVGRRYMSHNNAVVLAISHTPNPTRFQKTLGLNDFYHAPAAGGMQDWDYPLGHIQMVGKSDGAQIAGDVVPAALQVLAPDAPFDWLARHSLDFWLTSEDLPLPGNRIRYEGGRVRLDLTPTNMEAHHRLREELRLVGRAGAHPHLMDRSLYFGSNVPIGGTAHQAGTMVFGEDPANSVLDLDCKVHGIGNLYVADASFFPSIGAVNPTLTIVANALRVADCISRRITA